MLYFNFNDMPESLGDLMDLAQELAHNKNLFNNITDMVWDYARQSEQMPNFDNIYIYIVYSELENLILEKYGEKLKINYYINCLDSGFFVNNTIINSSYDLEQLLVA